VSSGLSLLPDNDASQETIFGVVIGLVSKADGDPDNLNRVLVDFPTLQVGSAWARVASFYAGPQKGAFFAPAEQDEVLVAFEQGDVSRPYVIGVLWNGVDTPPVANEKVADVRTIQTASGAKLEFDDTSGAMKITVVDSAGNSVVIDTSNKAVTISSAKDLTLSAPNGTISISGGQVNVSASGKLQISAEGEASMTATGELQLRGEMIQLN
jgi:uncharacterized protein involved in type VI secretion and phage assembly